MEFHIRQICEDDIPLFHEVFDEVAKEQEFLAWESAPDLSITSNFIKQNIEGDVPHLVAVDNSNNVLGWCDLYLEGRKSLSHSCILNIAVQKKHRGKGIGKRLLEEMINTAQNIPHIKRVELLVIEDNIAAINLYKSFNFKQEGVKIGSIKLKGKLNNEVLMARDV